MLAALGEDHSTGVHPSKHICKGIATTKRLCYDGPIAVVANRNDKLRFRGKSSLRNKAG